MSARPWYKWFPQDWASKTALLTLEEKGAYRELLDHLWMAGPFEPTTDNLRRIWRLDTRQVKRIWRVVSPYLELSNGLVDHPKLSKQRAEVAEKSDKARAAGRKGGVANAVATRARARAGTDSDPDKDLNQTQDPLTVAPDRNGQPASLTPEQRRQAEVIDAKLRDRRRANGLSATGPLRAVAAVAQLRPDCEMDQE